MRVQQTFVSGHLMTSAIQAGPALFIYLSSVALIRTVIDFMMNADIL